MIREIFPLLHSEVDSVLLFLFIQQYSKFVFANVLSILQSRRGSWRKCGLEIVSYLRNPGADLSYGDCYGSSLVCRARSLSCPIMPGAIIGLCHFIWAAGSSVPQPLPHQVGVHQARAICPRRAARLAHQRGAYQAYQAGAICQRRERST